MLSLDLFGVTRFLKWIYDGAKDFQLLQMAILTVVLWYGGHLVIKGKVESGLLVSFLLYQFQLGENLRVSIFVFDGDILQELGEVWNGLMQAVGASRKVFEFIDREPRVNVMH